MKKTIKDLDNIKGKRILVREDLNVPLDENLNITDDTRIRAAVPTINYLREKGAKVIVVAHLGRPKGKFKDNMRLNPVAKRLSELLNAPVIKLDDCIGNEVKTKLAELKEGEVALLENIRFYNEEEANDPEFAKKLAELADIYVNDAFGTAHRAHASTEGVAKYLSPAVSGLLMEKELDALGGLLQSPKRPFVAIVGGSKVSTKIGVLENLMDKVDTLILGGGMTYTFMRAQGYSVGKSICEEDKLDIAKDLMKKAEQKGVKLVIPVDILIADAFSQDANTKIVSSKEIPDNWEGVDIGPKSRENINEILQEAKTILWNGPVGVFEIDKFAEGTKAVAQSVADATRKGAKSVLGGGDTVAAIEKFGISSESYSHISTGGGASLEFIEGKELPGVAALDEKVAVK
ncbi:MAG: phosphoglycerate kinase [Candidatus Melainabacteria bacterium GWF2_37_15]|nr:MAG: phosphoglycerate kinase [Candidatus Melainabacteria bacterium GWF2_37_15]